MYKYLTDEATKCVVFDGEQVDHIEVAYKSYSINRGNHIADIPYKYKEICTYLKQIECVFSAYVQIIEKVFSIYGLPIKFDKEHNKGWETDFYYKYMDSNGNVKSLDFNILSWNMHETPIAHLNGTKLYITNMYGVHKLMLLLLIDPLKCISILKIRHGESTWFFDRLEHIIHSHDVKYFLLQEIVRSGWLVDDLVFGIMDMYLEVIQY